MPVQVNGCQFDVFVRCIAPELMDDLQHIIINHHFRIRRQVVKRQHNAGLIQKGHFFR
jgi:hypothetical protein